MYYFSFIKNALYISYRGKLLKLYAKVKNNSPQKNLRKIYRLLVEVCFQDNKRPLP